MQDGSQSTFETFRPQTTDCEIIILIMKHLKNRLSHGSDEITLRFLKDSLPAVKFYITYLTKDRYFLVWKLYMQQNTTSGFSDKMEVIFSVPRGSVFRQVLFQIYVNNFSQYISDCLVIQYADDAQFIHPGTIGNIEQLDLKSEETLQRKE